MKSIITRLILCATLVSRTTWQFYVPGVAPVEYHAEDPIDVKAVKLTSVHTQLPYEYYSLPFCRPTNDVQYNTENLGEILRGDRIVNTAFKLRMKVESHCQKLCNSIKLSPDETNQLMTRIYEQYHVHLLVDNLPSATKIYSVNGNGYFYDHGYKLGFISGNNVVLNNHLVFRMKYHTPAEKVYRVVGFEVEAKSVNWKELTFEKDACSPKSGSLDSVGPFQLQEGKESEIMWTYSVEWEESDVKWASRWDTYLEMKDAKIHWFSIINSIVIVLCLSAFLTVIIIRTVRRDIAKYNKDDELDETLEESGWKLVHGDVFRPPPNAKLLVSLVGSGIHIFGMSLIIIVIAMLGMLSPASRGSLMTSGLFLYCFMGLVAGYYSGRLYKTLRGIQWKKAAFQTAALFPAVVFGLSFLLNFFIWGKHSSGAVPFTTMLTLLFMWLGIDVPLVYAGFYFGFRKQPYEHPVRTNQIPRQIPEQPWYLRGVVSNLAAGILPFGAMFIELFFIFSAIWEDQFYYLFGFLFLVFLILVIACGLISVVITYFQLCAESYRWWWRSFFVGGSSAIYIFAYSVFYYYTKLQIIGFIPTMLYFGYSFLIAFAFWLFSGTVGFFAAYYFVQNIYSAVKID